MTNEEINAKISEAREPFASLPNTTRVHGDISPGGGWTAYGGFEKWRYRQWTDDEDASAVLLEEMPEAMLMKDGDTWKCAPKDTGFTMNADRKRAIAEAWLKWKGKG